MVEPMIEALGLEKTVRSGEFPLTILKDLDFVVAAGSVVAIRGPSGSGKSTLLGLLAGLDHPTRGHVRIAGTGLGTLGEEELARFRSRNIGFVFQFLPPLPSLTAVENAELPLQLAGVRRPRGRAVEMLDMVGIAALADRHPHQLSGGEMQRVAIARALVHGPGLLLADEPTGSLDDEAAGSVIELLRDMRERLGTGILMATHSPEAAAAADRRLTLRDGRLDADDPSPGGSE